LLTHLGISGECLLDAIKRFIARTRRRADHVIAVFEIDRRERAARCCDYSGSAFPL
jgi:hypothetical protein